MNASVERPERARLAALFAFALLTRLVLLFALDSPRLAEPGDPWAWGHETACLANSLLQHDFYGDPWNQGTGPSTWLTPPYPAYTAACLALGGGVTRASATIFFAGQCVLSAATCVVLVLLGAALGRLRVGWFAGVLFAVYPPSIWNAVDTVWDTTAVAFGVATFALAWVRALEAPSSRRLAATGLGFGALLFLNPAPGSWFLAVAASAWSAWRERAACVKRLALFAALAFVVVLPWMVRNARVIGTPSLRANLGVEMRLGNNDTSTGRPVPFRYHPSHVPEELALYRELGEKAYAENCLGRASDWIAAHPGRFAVLCLRRLQFFWVGDPPIFDARRAADLEARSDWKAWVKFAAFALAGLGALFAAWRLDLARPQKTFLLLGLALYGLPYFFTHVSERYRFPIDPLIVWLDAWLVVHALERRKARP
jgi:4-amino-4-deoxy-L-arabinose transferase-like glycosyltransferase